MICEQFEAPKESPIHLSAYVNIHRKIPKKKNN